MAGVVETWVGYLGGDGDAPTYESVCAGDGHTEAMRLKLDPSVITYEQFLETWLDDPRVANYPSARDAMKAQYKTAVWPQDEEQAAVAVRLVEASGKAVAVEEVATWHDAEEWHQHFYRDFKDVPSI